ncbi:MAG: hypothetical protein MZW92_18700 [Comamonadaceae bacterium]|nr:hypothetical protein [Comamonadaceae bacterium]
MFFLFPAGLVLYWLVNNILSIAQQWYVTKQIAARRSRSADGARRAASASGAAAGTAARATATAVHCSTRAADSPPCSAPAREHEQHDAAGEHVQHQAGVDPGAAAVVERQAAADQRGDQHREHDRDQHAGQRAAVADQRIVVVGHAARRRDEAARQGCQKPPPRRCASVCPSLSRPRPDRRHRHRARAAAASASCASRATTWRR